MGFICWRRRKSTKESKKKPSQYFNTKGFLSEKIEKHETGDAKGDKKNTMNQMENGTRKTCVRKIKTRGKRETQREQSEKEKKRRRTNEKMQRRQKNRGDKQEDFSSIKRRGRKKEE